MAPSSIGVVSVDTSASCRLRSRGSCTDPCLVARAERADCRSYRIMADAGVAWVEAGLVHAG
jgi:hypothetical protein